MIQVLSITPEKGTTNVPISQDIEMRVQADFELDPRNVSFKLNDVEVVPNVFSVYQGDSEFELVITLYTRKRIKYGNKQRYGQAGVRYGRRDDLPSILQYNSRYVCEFNVWGEEDSLRDSFVFITEEGVFENKNPSTYFYSTATQGIANYYPEWSKTRYDKYSNAQQMLNPIGENLQAIQELVKKESANSFVQTANLRELSELHRVELDKDFEMTSILNQDGSYFFVQPDISGVQGITRFDLFTEQENDLKTFYRGKLPTRIDSTREELKEKMIWGPALASEMKTEINQTLSREGGFCLTCSDIESSMKKTESEAIVFAQCRVFGKDIFGVEQEEDLIVLGHQNVYSRKMWSEILYIRFSNLPHSSVSFSLLHFEDAGSPMIDIAEEVLADDTEETLIWTLEQRSGRSILQKNRTLGQNNFEMLRNSGQYIPYWESELLDVDGKTSLNLVDIAVDSFSNSIYGIDEDYLYIFDKREEYPLCLKAINGDNGNSDFLIELDSDEMSLDEDGEKEILFKCIHGRPGQNIIRYRLKITKPGGDSVFLKPNGEETTDVKKSMIFAKQVDLTLEEVQYSFILDQTGDYLFELEALFQGGETTKHQQLVRVLSNSAKIKYKLERILNNQSPVGLVFDYDQKLKVLTEDNILHTIIEKRDGVLIDYENKILYFSEEYELIDVE